MKKTVLFILFAAFYLASQAQQVLFVNPEIGKKYNYTVIVDYNDSKENGTAGIYFDFAPVHINDSGNFLIKVWLKRVTFSSLSMRDTISFDSDNPGATRGKGFGRKDLEDMAGFFEVFKDNPVTLEVSKTLKIVNIQGMEELLTKMDKIERKDVTAGADELKNHAAHLENTAARIKTYIVGAFSYQSGIYGKPLQAGDAIEFKKDNALFTQMHWGMATDAHYSVVSTNKDNITLKGTSVLTASFSAPQLEEDKSLPDTTLMIMIDSIKKIPLGRGTSDVVINAKTGIVERSEQEFFISKRRLADKKEDTPDKQVHIRIASTINKAE